MTFDTQVQMSLERMLASIRGPLETELRAYAEELDRIAARAAEEAAAAALEESRRDAEREISGIREQAARDAEAARAAQSEAEAATARADAARAEADAARAEAEAARREADAARTDADAARADAAAAREQADAARSDAVVARAEAEAAKTHVESARADADAARAELETAKGQLEAIRIEADAIRARAETAEQQTESVKRQMDEQLASVQGDAESVRRELEAARTAMFEAVDRSARDLEDARASARTQVEALEAQLEETRRGNEDRVAALQGQLDEAFQQLATARDALAGEQRAALTTGERLSAAFRGLEEAGSLGEVLESLGRHARVLAARAGVFVVKDGRVRDWSLAGFDAAGPRGGVVDQPVAAAGLLGLAARDGRPVVRADRDGGWDDPDRALPAFAADAGARDAAAIPLQVGRRVVAVLYADAPAANASAAWPAALELLARHASLVLETMTVQRAAGLRPSPSVAQPPPQALAGS